VADGGVISTAGDLVRFTRALHTGKLLSAERFAQMQDWVDDGEGGLYGLGFMAYDEDSAGRITGHSGTASGFGSEVYYLEDSDTVIIVLFGSMDLQSDYSEQLFDELVKYAIKH
jgi:D-alanyl-D-alanine carboxypeptidase